jgi:hypothetical protein
VVIYWLIVPAWVAGETEALGGNLPQYCYVHHRSKITWRGLEPGPSRRDCLSSNTAEVSSWFCCYWIMAEILSKHLKWENIIMTDEISSIVPQWGVNSYVWFEVLTAVAKEIASFWDVTPCSLLKDSCPIRDAELYLSLAFTLPYCLTSFSTLQMEAVCLSKHALYLNCSAVLYPRRYSSSSEMFSTYY